MTTPYIETSKREVPFAHELREIRLDYVRKKWECMHNCELHVKCHIIKGRDAETLYADYIEGKRTYLDITLEIRK